MIIIVRSLKLFNLYEVTKHTRVNFLLQYYIAYSEFPVGDKVL